MAKIRDTTNDHIIDICRTSTRNFKGSAVLYL